MLKLKSCELETLKMETHLADFKKKGMLESNKTLKNRAEQAKVARKQIKERQAKLIATKATLLNAELKPEI